MLLSELEAAEVGEVNEEACVVSRAECCVISSCRDKAVKPDEVMDEVKLDFDTEDVGIVEPEAALDVTNGPTAEGAERRKVVAETTEGA